MIGAVFLIKRANQTSKICSVSYKTRKSDIENLQTLQIVFRMCRMPALQIFVDGQVPYTVAPGAEYEARRLVLQVCKFESSG